MSKRRVSSVSTGELHGVLTLRWSTPALAVSKLADALVGVEQDLANIAASSNPAQHVVNDVQSAYHDIRREDHPTVPDR
jgi:hypothetical protein